MRNLASNKRTHDRRTGATAVEFALVAPIIFFVFMGSIEIANMNFVRNMANDAAYQVARRGIVPGGDTTAAIADARSLLASAGITQANFVATESSDSVSVRVTVPIDDNSWGLGKFIAGKSLVQFCELSKQVKSGI